MSWGFQGWSEPPKTEELQISFDEICDHCSCHPRFPLLFAVSSVFYDRFPPEPLGRMLIWENCLESLDLDHSSELSFYSHSHGATPRAGWFQWKILWKWMMTGGSPYLRTTPYSQKTFQEPHGIGWGKLWQIQNEVCQLQKLEPRGRSFWWHGRILREIPFF